MFATGTFVRRVSDFTTTFSDENDMSALHHAVYGRYSEIASLLIVEGADINALDNKGRSPLQLASESGDSATVRLLVENGAKLDVRDKDGRTALD